MNTIMFITLKGLGPGCLIDIENLMITKKDTLYTNALIRLQDGPHPKGL